MIRLHFYISLRKDREYILKSFPLMLKLFKKKTFSNWLNEYYSDFQSSNYLKFLSFWEENKQKILTELKKSSKTIIKEWRRKEKGFFEKVEEEFGPWKRKKYFCHLSSTYICGGSYEYPTVIIFPFSKHVYPIETIQHELLHLHIVEDMKRLKLKPKNYFKFSEIAVAFASKRIGIKPKFPNEETERYFEKIKRRKIEDWEEFLCFLSQII